MNGVIRRKYYKSLGCDDPYLWDQRRTTEHFSITTLLLETLLVGEAAYGRVKEAVGTGR